MAIIKIKNQAIDLDAAEIPNLPASKITSGTFADARISNQNKVVKSANAPTSPTPVEGDLWYDTTNEILLVYNSTESAFVKISRITPTLSSVSGTIINGLASNLTLSGTGFLESNLIISFTPSGGSASTVTVTPTSSTLATVAVPSAIYGQSANTVIAIKVTNSDSQDSGNVNKTVVDLPTGGTISSYGSTRVHTFTSSSSNFVVPATFSTSVDTLLVAGGGAGGNWHAGGGGAGGMFTYTHTPSAGTYAIVVGAGGPGGTTSVGSSGGNTTAFSQTAIGGGRGGNYNVTTPASGGSGAGGNATSDSSYSSGVAGTAGQGNAGGNGGFDHTGGGGGGKAAVGANANGTTNAGDGGLGGTNNYQTGSNQYYAGGGGGGNWNSGIIAQGGNGGGGNGSYAQNTGSPTPGTVNTGGGGGGTASQGQNTSYAAQTTGGSGIVIIKYAI
tara:strand:- start:15 stop:1346 length:1332 start_codon:yes stop_codon:yes gene_type:complete